MRLTPRGGGKMKLVTVSEKSIREARSGLMCCKAEVEDREKNKTELEEKLEAEKEHTHILRLVLGRTVSYLEASRANHETTKDSLRTVERNVEIAKQRENALHRRISSLETSSGSLKTQLAVAKGKQSTHDCQVGRFAADIVRSKRDLKGRNLRVKGVEEEVRLLHLNVDRLGETVEEERSQKNKLKRTS